MPTYTLECYNVDTCLSCYVLDHCNGEDEMLVGVPVDRSTRYYQLKLELESEVAAYGDKLPDEIPERQVRDAIGECFAGAHPLATFDSSLDSAAAYEDGESVYAWFRFTWEHVCDDCGCTLPPEDVDCTLCEACDDKADHQPNV
jgi:hypothetical protein